MKNVLIIAGSPRKGGNSEILAREFARGAESTGNRVEIVTLHDKKIGYCKACDFCVSHNGKCAIQDGMAEILDKMIAADVIVLASPVYFYSIDAQLKAVIDRCVARYTEIVGSELYYIMTAAENSESTFDGSIACFRGFADCLTGSKECGMILGGGAWKKGDINRTKSIAEAFELGSKV